jgi:hypothetical protein
MRCQNAPVERLATRQHGVVTRAELLAAGFSTSAIDRRVRSGLLLREYPGVYRLGHRAYSVEAQYLAAVKACGDGSLLAGRAAAHLYGLTRGQPPKPEVATPTKRRIGGITTHRSRPRATKYRGIPIATVPEVLVQLAAVLDIDDLARWPEYGLTVELNSYTAHDSRHAWERDHVRAREAYARGDGFRAYTYRDVFEDPTLMLAELRRLLT